MSDPAVASILANSDAPNVKLEKLGLYLEDLFTKASVDGLKAFVNTLLPESVSSVISRQMLKAFSQGINTLVQKKNKERNLNREQIKQLTHYAVDQIQERGLSFFDEVTTLRRALSKIYTEEEEWKEAANTLISIPLEQGHRKVSSDEKLEIYLQIAALCLQDEDAVQAESYVNRASRLESDSSRVELRRQYKAYHVRIQDAKRKFIEAALGYAQLSYITQVPEVERKQALELAVNCTILASAGPQRSRMLATLYKDERCKELKSWSILEATYNEKMISKQQVQTFSEKLMPHQKAITSDGQTILQKAIVMHNMHAASKLYQNIRFDELGLLLGISGSSAEQVAASMISEGRMNGHIDQILQIVEFKGIPSEVEAPRSRADQQVHAACTQVNSVVEMLELAHPQWIKTQYAD
eukprot:m.156778 g.156778  ORF g.156778 m.156778 type:complete len:412 (-) comp31024_c1_seq1:364-1599(-)